MSEESKTYEHILAELETEVKRLEQGDLPLEQALAAFEKGMKLAQQGQKTLEAAEQRVEVLTAVNNGEAETEPLQSDVRDE